VRRGGLNRYFSHLVRSLSEIGVSVRSISMGLVEAASENEHGTVVPAEGSIVHRMLGIRGAASEELREANIIDAHFALTALPLITNRFNHVPLLIHFQGPWADEGAASGQGRLVCGVKRAIELLVYKRSAGFVVLSIAFRRLLIERYGVAPWNIEVIPPGVDTNHFRQGNKESARSVLGVPHDALVVVTVRRLVPRMGLDVMIDAWSTVVPRLGSEAHWYVVGEGPSRVELENHVARAGLSGSIHFLGEVQDDLLVTCYQAADLSVVPSLELEGFGLTTLESLSCGTPVVASNLGGLREAVGILAPELLVPPGDAASLAERLEGALTGTIAMPSSLECRRYAMQFSWDKVARDHVALFKEILVAHRSSRDRQMTLAKGRNLRVLVVGHTAALSGGELAILRLIEAMPSVKVHVILAEEGPLVALLESAGATVEVLKMHQSARELRRGRATLSRVPARAAIAVALYTVRLARRIRRIDPDLVHTNTLKAAIYGGIAAKVVRRPCLWHIRDRISDDYLPHSSARMIRMLARVVPTEIVANSNATLEALNSEHRAQLGIRALPTSTVVPSPVTIGDRVPNRTVDRDTLTFVMVGRLTPWKGQDVFLRAFAEAFPQGPHRVILAGSPMFGEEAYHDALRHLARTLGISSRVEFRGFVHDVPRLLEEADVLVHASVIPEPFGQVIVEGMASGLAVVASDEGGPAETVTNEFDGLLVPQGDAMALAESLYRLGHDHELRMRLGNNAQITARKYRPEVIAPLMLSVYSRLAQKSAPRLSNRVVAGRYQELS
jgi:glycosyltransferase involved in cell wall biosynthesis